MVVQQVALDISNVADTAVCGKRPRITACVCTHDRSDYLQDCLDGLRAQSVGPTAFDILVVDSGSSPWQAARIADLVADTVNARLLRVIQPGLSRARNAAARSIGSGYVAYLDDDAIPTQDWIATIQSAVVGACPPPALIGGAIWPLWEAPLPGWWPVALYGVLSIIDIEGQGHYSHSGVARVLEPYGANMIIHVPELLAVGGFLETIGRQGMVLLSDEEKVLTWRLQEAGHSTLYDSRIIVHHQIQCARLTVDWLLARMYWQGVSASRSGRLLRPGGRIWDEVLRRLLVFLMLAPVAVLPSSHAWAMGLRWRWAYAHGALRGAAEDGLERSGRRKRSWQVFRWPTLKH